MGGVLLKVLYSALLVALSALLVRELWKVWFDHQVYIGRFDVVSETGKDEEAGAAFAKRIVGAQAILAQQLLEYQTRSSADAPTDATYLLPGTAPLLLPRKALEGVEITVQNVNLSQLLTVVRRGLVAPDEVQGHVTIREGSVLTAVDWPRAPKSADSTAPPLKQFLTPSMSTVQDAAAYVACSVSWARATSAEPRIATLSRAQFCDFSTALGDLYALGGKASNPAGLSDQDVALVRARATQLRSHYGAGNVFPELYRLRADLLDLLPEKQRIQNELIDAQEDRLRYAMRSPKLKDLSEEAKRHAALALARPAILVDPTKALQAPKNWASVLDPYDSRIRGAAASTGLIVYGDLPVGSGFIVGPGMFMTTGPALDDTHRRLGRTPTPRLCLGQSVNRCEPALEIGDIVFQSEGSEIVIGSLLAHDDVLYPALPISSPLPEPNTLIGRYAFVIGYPFSDERLPADFVHLLLGETPGLKRVMPGRILALGDAVGAGLLKRGSDRPPIFTTDISTTAGAGGGPLIDLMTGAVVGVSYSGRWQGERGKFAYALSVPRAAVDFINAKSSPVQAPKLQPPKTTP